MRRARAFDGRGFEGATAEPTASEHGGSAESVSSPPTQLLVEGMPLVLHVGWTQQERAQARPVWVDLVLDVSYDGSGDLSGTVDLDTVVGVAQSLAGEEHRLVEDVAQRLAQKLLESFARLMGVRVAVRKPCPPAGVPVAATGAVVVRRRDG